MLDEGHSTKKRTCKQPHTKVCSQRYFAYPVFGAFEKELQKTSLHPSVPPHRTARFSPECFRRQYIYTYIYIYLDLLVKFISTFRFWKYNKNTLQKTLRKFILFFFIMETDYLHCDVLSEAEESVNDQNIAIEHNGS